MQYIHVHLILCLVLHLMQCDALMTVWACGSNLGLVCSPIEEPSCSPAPPLSQTGDAIYAIRTAEILSESIIVIRYHNHC